MADVNNIFPYNKMRVVQINGYDFMEIPKLYIRTSQDSSGLITREICEVKAEGFRIHPAFVYQNRIYDYLYIESYPSGQRMQGVSLEYFNATLSKTVNEFKALNVSDAVYVNYPMLNIYQYSLILLLMLIENESANLMPMIAYDYNYNWRGYHDWGSDCIYGFSMLDKSSAFRVLDNLGRGIFLEFSFPFTIAGEYAVFGIRGDVGAGYNFQDLFIANELSIRTDVPVSYQTYCEYFAGGNANTGHWSGGVLTRSFFRGFGFIYAYESGGWTAYHKLAFLRNEKIVP